MPVPKVVKAEVLYDMGVGTFTYENGTIGGKPFPSEEQAWAFSKGLEIMQKFMLLSHEQQLKVLRSFDYDIE
jgi:hypothetical protein